MSADPATGVELYIRAQATIPELLACLDRIGELGVTGKLDRSLANRLRLVVEELFSNTIKYGYGGEGLGEARIGIEIAEGGVILRYEDDAPAFDPTAWTPIGDRGDHVGQAGLDLVLGLAATAAWTPRDPGNLLLLTFVPA
jgi:anti-sigma regulatory factor (Ser/Thr protein kinase)